MVGPTLGGKFVYGKLGTWFGSRLDRVRFGSCSRFAFGSVRASGLVLFAVLVVVGLLVGLW
jgi:hypothetical protein